MNEVSTLKKQVKIYIDNADEKVMITAKDSG